MGHLLETSKRVEVDEAYASYGGDAPAAVEAPASDGWQPADGPPLGETADQLGESLQYEGGIEFTMGPGPIISQHVLEPLPSIGHWVTFFLRSGDSRNRRCQFPALVMDVDAERRELRLWVVVDDGDTWTQERVPEHREPEAGWEPIRGADPASDQVVRALLDNVDAMRRRQEETVEQLTIGLVSQQKRIEELEELTKRLSAQVWGNTLAQPESVLERLHEIERRIFVGDGSPTAVATAAHERPAVTPEMRGVPDGRETATSSRAARRKRG